MGQVWLAKHTELDTPFARSSLHGDVADGVPPMSVDFGGAMRLIGVRVAADEIAANSALNVDLYWRALQPTRADYSIQLSLRDAAGHLFGQSDSQNPAGFPTSRWSLDDYARDAHALGYRRLLCRSRWPSLRGGLRGSLGV